jgi:alpha-tubulin suppressor-like RCC1 family protein
MPRRVYSIGATGVPEALGGTDGKHVNLEHVWAMAAGANRLMYDPRTTLAGGPTAAYAGTAGTCFGLYALKYAVRGTPTEGMDERVSHVKSLDGFFADGAAGVAKVSGSGPVSLMLTTDGRLAAMGTGVAHNCEVALPVDAMGIRPVIADAAAGEGHYVCCDDRGRVFTWGWHNGYGQLGRGTVGDADPSLVGVHEPKAIVGFGVWDGDRPAGADKPPGTCALEMRPKPNIVAVACGRHHTVMLAESRTCVYTFGRGHCGQLGLGRPNAAHCARACVDILPSPSSVPTVFGNAVRGLVCAADSHFTTLVLATGALVSFGDNGCGQFGTGSGHSVKAPRMVCVPPDEQQRQDAEDVLTASVKHPVPALYGTIASYTKPARVPRLVKADAIFAPVVTLSSSATHSIVSDSNGRVLTSGLRPLCVVRAGQPVDSVGALGRPVSSAVDANTFGEIEGLRVAVPNGDRVVCGTGFSAVLLREANVLLVTGSISVGGKVIMGLGVDESLDFFPVDVGVGRTVVDVVPASGGGLLLVIDSPK